MKIKACISFPTDKIYTKVESKISPLNLGGGKENIQD